ncbi:MAG: stimulus-sensing domain-containing protein [Alphaproteobacteria bacterium]|nr:stimulus-sensing domain-containing protein [Alphaproteobacteria bacterium]
MLDTGIKNPPEALSGGHAGTASDRSHGPRRRGRRFSRLTGRILAINLLALALVAIGSLVLDRYRDQLVQAELRAMALQAEVLAQALGDSMVTMATDAAADPARDITPDLVQPIVRRFSAPVKTRIRVFDIDGRVIADSRVLRGPGGVVQVSPLPSDTEQPGQAGEVVDWVYERVSTGLNALDTVAKYREAGSVAEGGYVEVQSALLGQADSMLRRDRDGELILTVAAPVRSYRQVMGALMLTAEGEDIASAIKQVRLELLMLFVPAFVLLIALSFWLSRTITRPVVKLAAAAEKIRHGHHRATVIPDFSGRNDEIGDLSDAIKDMTEALWQRMDAIERFAADVSHEIKNPLTSLRSAVETAARLDDPEHQQKLMAIILDDVQRLDRLISDISDASRVDAEMSRGETEEISLAGMLSTLTEITNAGIDSDARAVRLVTHLPPGDPLMCRGLEGRLVQVFRNLIENARSFSPEGGTVRLSAHRLGQMGDGEMAEIIIEDDGPGVPEGKLEAIFDRFYSERPDREKFGTHSGLGLSISKQIIEAHDGTIRAANRYGGHGTVIGARFTVRLPLL